MIVIKTNLNEIPENCSGCDFCVRNEYCNLLNYLNYYNEETKDITIQQNTRSKHCPLIKEETKFLMPLVI